METGSDNPIKDLGAGLGKGFGEAVINKGLSILIQKFKDGKLAFIQERSIIDKARELLKSNEHHFYCNYIEEETKQILAVSGLTLRKLDEESLSERRESLVKKIKNKYDKGIYLSYLVQNGVLSRYITNLLENISDPLLFKEILKDFLNNLEKYVYFVHLDQNFNQVAENIKTKIVANSPKVFIISGMGSTRDIVSSAFELIKDDISQEYFFERYSSKKREIIFLNRKE